jgi:cysteine desulfurase / selenocysteine lyase
MSSANLLEPRLGDRSYFPSLKWASYLNHAAISPPSNRVVAAAAHTIDYYASHGVSAVLRGAQQRDCLHAKLATLIGARACEIGFVPSTSRGITDIALCFPWRRGDRVLLFGGEFPSNVTPWQQAAQLFDLELVVLPFAPFFQDGRTASRR